MKPISTIRPNQRLYNLAKDRARVAAKGNLSSMQAINHLYLTKIDLAKQRKDKIDHLLVKARSSKKPNWNRIDKLTQAKIDQIEIIKELSSLTHGLKK